MYVIYLQCTYPFIRDQTQFLYLFSFFLFNILYIPSQAINIEGLSGWVA